MNEQVKAREVFRKLQEMYTNLFKRERELKQSIKASNDEDDFNIYAKDDNSCVVSFNPNERNNYKSSYLIITNGMKTEGNDIYAITSIHNIRNIYYHFMKFKDLYRFMNSSYTIPIDEICKIIIRGQNFTISNEFNEFIIDYINEKPIVRDNSSVYAEYLPYDFTRSEELHYLLKKPIEVAKLPYFLKEQFDIQKENTSKDAKAPMQLTRK